MLSKQLDVTRASGGAVVDAVVYGSLTSSRMRRSRFFPWVPWLSSGLVIASCATPVREDPPSKLGAGETDSGNSSGNLTVSGATSGSASSTANNTTGAPSGASASTNGSGGAATTSSTSSADTTGASGTGGTGDTATSDGGSGGAATTSSTEAATSTASATSGVPITGDLPWTDDFEMYGVDGPADPNWTPLETSGGWTVISDGSTQLYAPASEAKNRNMTYAGDSAWTNVRLEVDVRLAAGGDSGTRIYLAARAATAGSKLDYYHAYLRGDGRVRLGKYVGGSTDETFSESVETGVELDETTWHSFALTVAGDTLTAELDGSEVDSATTTGLTSGFIALGVDGGTAEFDNVRVTEP